LIEFGLNFVKIITEQSATRGTCSRS